MKFLVGCFCRIYRVALHAYPADFRRRYEGEMAQVFADRCRHLARSQGVRGLLGFGVHTVTDWLITILREGTSSDSAEPAFDGAPVFYLYGSDRPSTGALLNGGGLSIFVFALISALIGIGVNHRRVIIVGSHHPSRSHLLAAQSTAEPVDLQSEVKVKPEPDQAPVTPYFRLLLVLGALDADQDNVISAAEIANAPAALRKLDKNHDRSLSAEECGLSFGRSVHLTPEQVKEAALRFMRFHPVHAALDADGDGRISAGEIRNSARSLENLDRNHDGSLTLDELLPETNAR